MLLKNRMDGNFIIQTVKLHQEEYLIGEKFHCDTVCFPLRLN